MSLLRSVPIPPPSSVVFQDVICHPDLWLWDSWVAGQGADLDIYCLALSRRTADGAPVDPARRNDFTFHVRRFHSGDRGAHWADRGCVIAPADAGDGAFARNVWSGSALDLADGRRLHAFTGVREAGPGHSFLQTLFLAVAPSADAAPQPADAALLCPRRDYDRIREAGYYLAPRDELGADAGEDGGPILAWRDPFLVERPDGQIDMVWAAKLGPRTPAVGRATLRSDGEGWSVAVLHAPTTLPDAALMTQAEVPKIRPDGKGGYFLLVSSCDRTHEGQPLEQVSMLLRLYRGDSLDGPWRAWSGAGSVLAGPDFAFGASFIADDGGDAVTLAAPITEQAPPSRRLTIETMRRVDLRDMMRQDRAITR